MEECPGEDRRSPGPGGSRAPWRAFGASGVLWYSGKAAVGEEGSMSGCDSFGVAVKAPLAVIGGQGQKLQEGQGSVCGVGQGNRAFRSSQAFE